MSWYVNCTGKGNALTVEIERQFKIAHDAEAGYSGAQPIVDAVRDIALASVSLNAEGLSVIASGSAQVASGAVATLGVSLEIKSVRILS